MNIDISDIDGLRQRLDEIDERFNRLIRTLRASFGDDDAHNQVFNLARIEDLEKQIEAARKWSSEQNSLIVEVARALGVKGGITKENLLKAAQCRSKAKTK